MQKIYVLRERISQNLVIPSDHTPHYTPGLHPLEKRKTSGIRIIYRCRNIGFDISLEFDRATYKRIYRLQTEGKNQSAAHQATSNRQIWPKAESNPSGARAQITKLKTTTNPRTRTAEPAPSNPLSPLSPKSPIPHIPPRSLGRKRGKGDLTTLKPPNPPFPPVGGLGGL